MTPVRNSITSQSLQRPAQRRDRRIASAMGAHRRAALTQSGSGREGDPVWHGGAGRAETPGSFTDARYLELIRANCSVLVPENELKSYVIAEKPGSYDFERGDRITGCRQTTSSSAATPCYGTATNTPRSGSSNPSAQNPQRKASDTCAITSSASARTSAIKSIPGMVNRTVDPATGGVRRRSRGCWDSTGLVRGRTRARAACSARLQRLHVLGRPR